MTRPKSVLVVDDEPLLRNAIAFDLKRKGYSVLCASNGREAFEIIKAGQIDMVISDVQMPGGNGIELLKKTKVFDPYLPVLMFVTSNNGPSLEQIYGLGASHILSKPFERKKLLELVAAALSTEPSGKLAKAGNS